MAKDCWTANIFIKVTYVLSEVIRARASSSLWLVETKTSKRKKNPKRLCTFFSLFVLSKCSPEIRRVPAFTYAYRRQRRDATGSRVNLFAPTFCVGVHRVVLRWTQ